MQELEIDIVILKPIVDYDEFSTEVFKKASFWQMKGYNIQRVAAGLKEFDPYEKIRGQQKKAGEDEDETIPGGDVDYVALDYYKSGVRIEPGHFGCIFNIARCYFNTKRYLNAKIWFTYASKANPDDTDSYYGLAASCIKLGLFEEARLNIRKIDRKGAHEEESGNNALSSFNASVKR